MHIAIITARKVAWLKVLILIRSFIYLFILLYSYVPALIGISCPDTTVVQTNRELTGERQNYIS